MGTRMVPFDRLVPRLRRIVRQVAGELGKQVEFSVGNADGEMDRTVLERIVAPLEHMLRNAVDHGIERSEQRLAAGKPEVGNIRLTLGREGGDILLTLSDDGVRLLPMVKALLQQEADIEFFLRNSGQGNGTLRIAATAPYYILDLVKAFRERLPQIEVAVDIGNSQQVLEALDEYRVDIAASSQLVEDPRLIRRILGADPLVLAVHRNHPLAKLEHVPLSALTGHCLLMREQGSTTRQLTEDLLANAGVSFGPLLEIGSRESIREAVLRGIGISIIARQEVPHDPQLRVLTLEGAPLIAEYLYCLKERKSARLPAAFLGLAQEMAPA